MLCPVPPLDRTLSKNNLSEEGTKGEQQAGFLEFAQSGFLSDTGNLQDFVVGFFLFYPSSNAVLYFLFGEITDL